MKPFIVVDMHTASCPSHWKRHRLTSLSSLIEEPDSDGSSKMLSLGSDGCLRSRNLESGQPPSPEYRLKYHRVRSGDLVVNPMWLSGSGIGVSDRAGAVSPEYRVYRFIPEVVPRFMHHLLRSRPYVDQYRLLVRAETTFDRRVTKEDFRELPLVIPSPKVQRAIADYLDTETARIDALIEKKSRMVELLDDAGLSRIESALYPPKGVPQVPLRRLLAEPPQYGASESGELGEPDWPRYIRITDLNADGSLRNDDVRRLPLKVARSYLLRDGDLLIARSGATVGKAFIYRSSMGPCCFAGYLIRFRFDPHKLRPELAALWTRTSSYWGQIREASLQATIENVSAERYKDLLVPVLPMTDQVRLIEEVEQRRPVQERMRSRLDRQLRLIAERRQALITAAVTGELDIPGMAA